MMRAGDDIGVLLNQLEAQLSDAFTTCSQLAVAASSFGGTARMTPRLAQPVVQELGGAMAAIAQAQGHAIGAHRSAERIGRFVGYGDGMLKPEEAFLSAVSSGMSADTVGGHLSVIANAA